MSPIAEGFLFCFFGCGRALVSMCSDKKQSTICWIREWKIPLFNMKHTSRRQNEITLSDWINSIEQRLTRDQLNGRYTLIVLKREENEGRISGIGFGSEYSVDGVVVELFKLLRGVNKFYLIMCCVVYTKEGASEMMTFRGLSVHELRPQQQKRWTKEVTKYKCVGGIFPWFSA